jgi:ABC-2 type transport system permease protein
MTTATLGAVALPRTPAGGRRVSQLGVVRSEWTKFRSLRSTRYSLLAAVVLTIGLGLVDTIGTVSQWSTMSASDKASFDPLASSLLGVNVGVMAIAVLGVLAFTSEFATGTVSSTFAAVPRRLPVLWAKAGIYMLVTLLISVPTMLIAFFAGQAVLSTNSLQIAFTNSDVPRAVIGAALYLVVTGLLALSVGAILRNTAAGIATVLGIMFVLPGLVAVLPSAFSNAITPYLPNSAGTAIMNIAPQAHALSPFVGLALFAGYAVAALAAAAVLLVRRDA